MELFIIYTVTGILVNVVLYITSRRATEEEDTEYEDSKAYLADRCEASGINGKWGVSMVMTVAIISLVMLWPVELVKNVFSK